MATTRGVVFLFMVINLLPFSFAFRTVSPRDGPDEVHLTSQLHDNGSVTVTCTIDDVVSDVHVIELLIDGVIVATIGTYKPEPTVVTKYDYWLVFRMGGRGPILRPSSWMEQLDGQVLSDTQPAFLSVQFNHTMCFDASFGCFFEGRSNPDLRGTRYLNVSVCDGPARLSRITSDVNDPAHFSLACTVKPEVTSVAHVTFMRIRRVVPGERSEFVASLNASDTQEGGQLVTSEWFSFNGMKFFGHLDRNDPSKSMLKIDSWLCEQAGDYVCDVLYTQRRGGQTLLAMAGDTRPNVCESSSTNPTPSLSLGFYETADVIFSFSDPTSFSVTCTGVDGGAMTTVGLEISFLQDETLERKNVASFSPVARLEAAYEKRGFVVEVTHVNITIPSLSVSSNTGTCTDSGVYRCTMTYWDDNFARMRLGVSEMRKPPCRKGAMITHKHHKHMEYQNGKFSFVCSANASVVHKLVSLEISRVDKWNRTVLASISMTSGDSQPIKHVKGRFHVNGVLDNDNATLSYLTVTSTVPRGDHPVRHTTTCKATFVPLSLGGVVVAMTDSVLQYSSY